MSIEPQGPKQVYDLTIPENQRKLEAADQLLGPLHGKGLDPAVLRALSASLQSGLGVVFWVIAGIALAAAATSLAFPNLSVAGGQPEQAAVGEPAGMTAVPPEP